MRTETFVAHKQKLREQHLNNPYIHTAKLAGTAVVRREVPGLLADAENGLSDTIRDLN
ncbi:hypothetical Protein YC6258_00228 [Gynuella sunshinyii YC6258]|uniref:Uncharacterized protein n=1 Tax=Gynuella sunshinyii YC6258 TaxID=1445510 RepID=A0A0C5UYD6_9GAMM|nr:hypothetical Protein YC6258_00228 [Gynuella sunshinyii YC6258]